MAASQEYLDLLDRVGRRVPALIEEMKTLHTQKANAYSGVDNPDTWANFRRATRWGMTALQGALVRKEDKIARTEVLLRNPGTPDGDESIEDTWVDEAAYSLICVALWREEFKAEQAEKAFLMASKAERREAELMAQQWWESLPLEEKVQRTMEAFNAS